MRTKRFLLWQNLNLSVILENQDSEKASKCSQTNKETPKYAYHGLFWGNFFEKNTILYDCKIVLYTEFTTFVPRFPQKAD